MLANSYLSPLKCVSLLFSLSTGAKFNEMPKMLEVITSNKILFIFRDGPSRDGFSLGKSDNMREVFGSNFFLMFLPVFTSLGDGISFPLRFSGDVELGTGALHR